MSVQSAKRKLTIEERQAEMLQKASRRKKPVRKYKRGPEARKRRMAKARAFLGVPVADIAFALGISESYARKIVDGERGKNLKQLRRISKLVYNRRQAGYIAKRRRLAKGVTVPDNQALIVDQDMRAEVILGYCTGESQEAIAQRLALRPEMVKFYLKFLAEDK